MFLQIDGELTLVGIISTVARDLSFNGVTPPSAWHELLNDTDRYTHDMTLTKPTASSVNIRRS